MAGYRLLFAHCYGVENADIRITYEYIGRAIPLHGAWVYGGL